MKRALLSAVFILFLVSSVFSSSIDYRGNQSADYNRTFVRNAALDSADIVNYNPAGTAFMQNGWHLHVANQIFFKDYTITAGGNDFNTDVPSLLVPSLYAVYKRDRLALFGAYTIPAGGGGLEYDNGVPGAYVVTAPILAAWNAATGATNVVVTSANLKAFSMYHGVTLGGAYSLTKQISVSLSGRFVYAKQEMTGTVNYLQFGGAANGSTLPLELDVELKATGIGGIVGVDFKISEKLNIGLRFETPTALEFEVTVHDGKSLGPMYTDGDKQVKDLPGLIAAGVSFKPIPKLNIGIAFMYFLIKAADGDAYDGYDNGFDLSVGVEYAIVPDLTVSIGYLYSKVGGNSDTYGDFDYALDNQNFSLGVKFNVNKMISISAAAVKSFYKEGSNIMGESFNKDVFTLALGLNFKL